MNALRENVKTFNVSMAFNLNNPQEIVEVFFVTNVNRISQTTFV